MHSHAIERATLQTPDTQTPLPLHGLVVHRWDLAGDETIVIDSDLNTLRRGVLRERSPLGGSRADRATGGVLADDRGVPRRALRPVQSERERSLAGDRSHT
jgi:hypothetical protein